MSVSTTTSLDPSSLPWADVPAEKPAPMVSLIASAKRLTSKKLKGQSFKKPSSEWQEDAWEMFDLVGEQRFLATTLAGRMAQAKFYVGSVDPSNPTDSPEPANDSMAQNILESVGGSSVGMAQLIQRLATNLFVAGDGYLVGVPKHYLPDYQRDEGLTINDIRNAPRLSDDDGGLTLDDLEWRMLSVSEIGYKTDDTVVLHIGSTSDEQVEVGADDIYLIRVWRPHPRKWWEADSPTRSSLPVLRELVGLTMHISAQVDSRLAGAGLLLVPQSAQRALKNALGKDDDDSEDVFTEALIEAMMTPINDRSAASAVVPLVVTVPDESTDQFRHMTFDAPLDAEARTLRDEAIRRLALGQDAPPELLLGVAGMNHWGAWLVREDVVSTHLEPTLALICDALTTQYLHPILEDQGYSEEQISNLVVWYDVAHMISRPNRATEAQALHDKGALSDEALREASGFDENDGPERGKLDLATSTALDMVRADPSLLTDPGLESIIERLRTAIQGKGTSGGTEDEPAVDVESGGEDAPSAPDAPPETVDDSADDPGFRAMNYSSDSALRTLQRAGYFNRREAATTRGR